MRFMESDRLGNIMTIDLYVKSQQLLERLANSIHDRDPKNINPFFFTISEIQTAEKWLMEFMEEIKKADNGGNRP